MDRPTRATIIPMHRNSMSNLLEMSAGRRLGRHTSNQSQGSDYAFCSTPTRLAVGLRQSGLNRCLDIRPKILRSFPGSPFSSCLFDEPKAKKKLGYLHAHDKAAPASSQDICSRRPDRSGEDKDVSQTLILALPRPPRICPRPRQGPESTFSPAKPRDRPAVYVIPAEAGIQVVH